MNKKSVVLVIIVAMLLTVSLYFVGGTYARYVSAFDGTASIGVAKWNVALKNGAAALENNFTLELTKEDNEFVVDGKIAPDVTATGKLELDLTGTEVAVDVEAKYDEATILDALHKLDESLEEDDISVEVKTYKSSDSETKADVAGTINLPGGAAFSGDEAKYTIEVSVTWVNDEARNDTDTNVGKKAVTSEGLKLEVPLKLTVKQHIKSA